MSRKQAGHSIRAHFHVQTILYLIGVEGLAGVPLGFDVRDRPQPFPNIANALLYDR